MKTNILIFLISFSFCISYAQEINLVDFSDIYSGKIIMNSPSEVYIKTKNSFEYSESFN